MAPDPTIIPWDAAVYRAAGDALLAGQSPWTVVPGLPGGWVYPVWWLWIAALASWSWPVWWGLVAASVVLMHAIWVRVYDVEPWSVLALTVVGLSLAGQTVLASGNAAALEALLVWGGLALWIDGDRGRVHDGWAATLIVVGASLKGPAIACLVPLLVDRRSRRQAVWALGAWTVAMSASYLLTPWGAHLPQLVVRPTILAATDIPMTADLPLVLPALIVGIPIWAATALSLPGCVRGHAALLAVSAWMATAPGVQPYTLIAAVPCVLGAATVVNRARYGGYVATIVIACLMLSPLAPGRLPLDLPRLLLGAPYLWIVATWSLLWIGRLRGLDVVAYGGRGARGPARRCWR